MNALTLKQVRFGYQATQIMQFDFSVLEGERLAVMGASGSGKSTLLHLIAGFETPQSGSISFGDTDLTMAEPAARPLTILFQDNNLFGHLTISQNVGLGIAPRLKLNEKQQEKVDVALAKVGLTALKNRLPSELSGGERQRAALARAILRDKPLLLLDEPFAALGPAMRLEMLDLVLALQSEQAAKQQPLTLIMVTHNPEDAAHFATRIGFVENGGLATTLPPEALDNPPTGSGLAAYLGGR
jgi:thiamine transport system ATP-binding protein